jgi:L-ascorbate metabolism protein UlaG (beta-lactamase superfamily)
MKKILPALFLVFLGISCTEKTPLKKEINDFLSQVRWEYSRNGYGSTCVSFEMAGKKIYVDPAQLPTAGNLEKADFIFITHEHEDHYYATTIKTLTKEGTKVIFPKHMTGSNPEREFLANGEEKDFGGFKVQAVKMNGPNHTQGNGYIFKGEGVTVFCSGDTSANDSILSLSGIDIAIVNFKPPYTWDEKALTEWVEAVKPTVLVPIHFTSDQKKAIDQLVKNLGKKTRVILLKEED